MRVIELFAKALLSLLMQTLCLPLLQHSQVFELFLLQIHIGLKACGSSFSLLESPGTAHNRLYPVGLDIVAAPLPGTSKLGVMFG